MGSPGAGYVGEGVGAGLTGYGLSMNPTLNYVNPLTEFYPDQSAIQQQTGVQQGITNQGLTGQTGLNSTGLSNQYDLQNQSLGTQSGINSSSTAEQQNLLNQALGQLNSTDQSQMNTLTQQLSPTGSIGQQLMGEFNNYGITPSSGAFQEGLANQYGNLAMQQQQQNANLIGQGYGNIAGSAQTGSNDLSSILGLGTQLQGTQNQAGYNNLSNIFGEGTQTQSGLGQTGLENTLGLQSQGVNTTNAQNLAQFLQQTGLQQALVGGGANVIGQSAGGK